ncbi:hypothetical protein [Plantactinospora sp. B5E13]|uniref:hypothetical protein n=1 Tax=unclassified Plantactinospora TaxID=2631981 RepID=UPI00325E15CA
MSNSYAHPILRTTDLERAHALARRLVALAGRDYFVPRVRMHAETRTHQLGRYLAAIPDGRFDLAVPGELADLARRILGPYVKPQDLQARLRDGTLWLYPVFNAESVAALGRLPELPCEVELTHQPVGTVEERFLAVIGPDPAEVVWEDVTWPPVEELELCTWEVKHGNIQLTLNAAGVFQERPADDHTLYVHVRWGDERRAQWLAEQVGLKVIGPPETGF